MSKYTVKFKEGTQWRGKQGNFQIIKYTNQNNILIRFDCGYEKVTNSKSISKGTVKNPFFPTICGKGFIGDGSVYKKGCSERKTSYYVWKSMLTRCYGGYRKNRTYSDVTVCDEWLCYTSFEQWFDYNYKEGFHLDKDLKVKGAKVYCPETCSFIPAEINCILGYKTYKEGFIYNDLPVGVSYHKKDKKYYSNCNENGLPLGSSSFDCPVEAFQDYKIKKEDVIKAKANQYFKNLSICKQVYKTLMDWEIVPFPLEGATPEHCLP